MVKNRAQDAPRSLLGVPGTFWRDPENPKTYFFFILELFWSTKYEKSGQMDVKREARATQNSEMEAKMEATGIKNASKIDAKTWLEKSLKKTLKKTQK